MARNRPGTPRVFCVGWHKTGTSTLGLALIKLGYSVMGARLDTIAALDAGDIAGVLDLAESFDALQDVPWAALYRELDERYPGSRFILTVREELSWQRSALRHFGATDIPLHRWLYGDGKMEGNEALYVERFRQHNQAVLEYFSGRGADFLEMDLAAGDGWEPLCRFLGREIPRSAFPHANKGPHSLSGPERLLRSLRDRIPKPVRQLVFAGRLRLRRALGLSDPRDVFNNMAANRAERASRTKEGG